jgi:(R,R)-butanediol dehydrogenase/meso-butanediol dehydrogenase/diacetyl reductase
MRTLRLHGPRDPRIENVQRPDLRPGTVRIDVAFGGICGSDLALYQDAPVPQDYANPIMGETGPHSLGNEFAGYVVEVAADVDSHAIGGPRRSAAKLCCTVPAHAGASASSSW